MSNYIKENLGSNEKVIMEAKVNKLCIIPNIIGISIYVILFFWLNSSFLKLNDYMVSIGDEAAPDFVFLMVRCFLLAILLPLVISNIVTILSRLNATLAVTNKRVLGKRGLLSIKAIDYPIDKIDNVSLSTGFFGRIFKYYNLSVKTAGDGMPNAVNAVGGIMFSGIENAVEFKNHITIAIEEHAEEARKLQAKEIAKAMEKN